MRILSIVLVLLILNSAQAATNYVFEALMSNDVLTSSFETQDATLPAGFVIPKQKRTPEIQGYRMYVTKAQFDAGWTLLPQIVKDAGKDTAKDNLADLDADKNMDKSMMKAVLDLINDLELNAGLPKTSYGQLKQKVKDKYKNP